MYILKKMNREKKAANESERDALIQKGYKLVGKTIENGISVKMDVDTDKFVEKLKEVTDVSPEEKVEEEDPDVKYEKKGTKKKV